MYIADAVPGYPCRQCLRDAEIGEEVILVSYDPFRSDTPYRSASPIFLHCADCGGPDDVTSVPQQLARRQLSVRSFDRHEMMIDAAVIDGDELAATMQRFFAEADTRGCWATAVARAGAGGGSHSAASSNPRAVQNS